jgi:periplasmic copper chaperone A
MRSILFAAALLAATPALAQSPAVEVAHPWARATAPSMKAGGAFITLTDKGTPDRLVGASTPIAQSAELHRTVNDRGVMRMLPVDGVDLAPGSPVEFKPGGYHIMLMGLQQQLKPGDTFPLTLTFARSAPQTVTVTVTTAGAMGPGMQHMHTSP